MSDASPAGSSAQPAAAQPVAGVPGVLAERLTALLGDAQVPAHALAAVRVMAEQWSLAVWREAQVAGPIEPDPDDVIRADALLARPVFVCGAHRSGTTLMRNLLDDHPQLLVLPSEGLRPVALARALRRRPDFAALDWYGQEWLRRLANPINLPPYWVLDQAGDRQAGASGLRFARSLMGWWRWCRQRYAHQHPLWPTMAALLAYGCCGVGGRLQPHWQRWVEKTPTNECEADALLRWFPQGRVVQLVRAPQEVLASRRGVAGGALRAVPWRAVRDLRRSYLHASRARRAGLASGHAVVRYDQLLRTPEATMREVAVHLGIAFADSLLHSTVNGLAAPANSSFQRGSERGAILAARGGTTDDRWHDWLLRACLARSAARLDYRWPARRRNWRMK